MKSVLTVILAAATTTNSAPLMPNSYSLICAGKSATGFNWRARSWVQTTFKPETYIFMVSYSNDCFENIDLSAQDVAEGFVTREICANVRKQGEEYRPKISGKCTEYYIKGKADSWSSTFSCEGFFTGEIKGKFDGAFTRVVANDNFDDALTYKDSMFIEVGTCSRIM